MLTRLGLRTARPVEHVQLAPVPSPRSHPAGLPAG